MSFDDALWLLTRARGPQRVARCVILVAALLATACTAVAAGGSSLFVSGAIALLAIACVVFPDSHLGLVLVLAIGAEWLVRVDDGLTPWSIVIAGLLGVLHLAAAMAGTAPAAALLDRSVVAVWSRRAVGSSAVGGAVWALVAGFDRWDAGPQPLLVVAGLVALAGVGFWLGSPPREQRPAG